ncbi:protein kinase domain-containing protein [Dapis sp. BLCC M229]|uniref:trifunctional serine/threonine-protein kinase/ATP-binding protein/sensor histidine kinase n=1 Tax=Dapis sp. BLCC M229 TaxID=3400188 RepID=UPI003CF0E7FB
MVSKKVNLLGYHISKELYNGYRTIVYQGYRVSDQLPVVIKLLKNDYPSFSELVQFRNQYTITKNLNSPLIIHTYSLEPYENGYALVMEDFGGISLQEWLVKKEKKLYLIEFLEVAISLCNALDILYHERIIHKDIKPSNILINPETQQLKLIDFSIASLLPKETQTLVNPNILEGTLAYISPEQTGRMNRGIDYRTDFYSLGITFYKLLTGELPFTSNDAMELVHCHLAKSPPVVNEINPQIPSVLSKIVSKLMAKNAEDRYQSALGLKLDIETCLHQLIETGEIEDFEIGQRDISDRFIIPDKLYGREAEVLALLEAFERVSNPPQSPLSKGGEVRAEMMLVAGFSGIGKTAVVNEVHKPIVRQRGYFIKGKYDQFQRNIPFSAFVQAFRDLMGQLLTESDSKIQEWKGKILEAVGENGQVIIEVIPELEKIIGEQRPVTELLGTAAQNRFNLLFQKFTQVFTSVEHPLVMFLDDLQWADSASLKLIQLLIADTNYLFLIGAYRDNEVNPAHPLMLTLSEIEKTEAIVNTITLLPLSKVQVNKLVADTLKCTENLALSFSQLIHQKTQGNPFFATQFLKALYQEKLIEFDFQLGCWQCDMARVNQQALTDDVVEFMALQLQKLPTSTQNILQLAACIGNQFDLATLAIVSEQLEVETSADLWKALQSGLILPISDIYKFYQQDSFINNLGDDNGKVTASYKFLHDRIQQAAYSLIPENQKQTTHLKLGNLLLNSTSKNELEENIFAIVNQLNFGSELIKERLKRHELAELNLLAGRKAKAATAYASAIEYLFTGCKLLAENSWQTNYILALTLFESAAETAYLNGSFEQMKKCVETVLQNAKTFLDKVKIYDINIQALTAQNKLQDAVSTGLEVLEKLEINFGAYPEKVDLEPAIEETKNNLSGWEIEELITLPKMTDPDQLAAMQIISTTIAPAYVGAPDLLPLLVLKQVNLSLEFGNTELSAYAYVMYGLILCGVLGNIELGYKFGILANQLLDKFDCQQFECRILNIFNGFIRHWQQPLHTTIKFLEKGYKVGIDRGEIEFVGYCALNNSLNSFWSGQELTETEQKIANYTAAMGEFNQQTICTYLKIYWQLILNLLDDVDDDQKPWELNGSAYQETTMLSVHQEANDAYALAQLYLSKLFLHYLFDDYSEAIATAELGKTYIGVLVGNAAVPIFPFYDSLARLAAWNQLITSTQEDVLKLVAANQQKMKNWADRSPENYLSKFYLVEAERYRVLGNKTEAIELYERAISLAQENEYIQEEALGNELAAKFYLDWGKQKVASGYMQEAYYCYVRWGAKAKIADLEKRYPQLLTAILQRTSSTLLNHETTLPLGTLTSTSSATATSSVSAALDLATILKAYQALSSEMELEKLLSLLLSIVIENAGADKCVLMLLPEERLLIEGSVTVGKEPVVLQHLPIEDSQVIPLKLIYKVKHERQTVMFVDVSNEPSLTNDQYIISQQPKSILCSPILHQGKLQGILYLENNLATGAFTRDSVELLNLLCTQVAISLENSRLYERSQQYAQQLEQSLSELSASNSRFHNLVDNVPGLVYQFCISPSGLRTLTYMSADCYRFYEVTAEEAISNIQILTDMIHPDDIIEHNQSIADSIQNLDPWHWEGRMVTPSGIIKWVHCEARIAQRADGTLVLDGMTWDISRRKQAELALEQKSQDLQKALTDLQQAQLQIIQSEKMSALGNLVAGVGHEMNNPLGFISASIELAKPTITDIIEHLRLYQESLPNKTDEIIDHAEEIDLDYSLEDLPKMIDSMMMACDRLKNISTSLRTFSRADKDYKVPFNIHEGIDSTLLILKHRLKANQTRPAIEVVTNYGNIPVINCFPGQLNQVFMNIIANGIDALDESNLGRNFTKIEANPNRITIQTSVENEKVKITIADNGKGMSESVKQKIFDHLFTTKAVGKGTGLGLAITKSIVVEKHGGTITVKSQLGEGTEFMITLPMTAKRKI